MKNGLFVMLLGATLLAIGCASTGEPGTASARRDARVIALDEIRSSNVENVLDLVRASRPGWLRVRGARTVENDQGIVVYLDQTRLGPVEAMRDVHPQDVESLTFFDAAAANHRFGQGHLHGAIVISTRRGS